MNTLGIFGIIGGGLVLIGAFLISALQRSAKEAGRNEARAEEMARADEAKERANAVLAEHREPSDADKRLRDGTF